VILKVVTITVTDSTSRPVANAQVSGILLYPGDNFEREFGGITNIRGSLSSWVIGNKGDIGTLL
jgi:hypothetical protein